MSGPFVTGQTRISSSLVSTKLLLDTLDERRIDGGAHRQIPAALIGKSATFYRILLGHQHGGCGGQRELGGSEPMMIGIGVLDRIDAKRAQLREKSRRIADAGDGMHAA